MAKKRGYKFTNKRHSGKGIFSTEVAALSIVLFGFMIYLSYLSKGSGELYIGSVGVVAIIMAAVGLVYGLRGFQEKERYKLFPTLGSLLSVLILAVWIGIYLIGF